MPAVQLNNIKKCYGALCVLDGINLSVEPRDVVAVIGQSGSGKSTMLRCINGLEQIQGGSIDIVGHRIEPGTHSLRSLRKEVGMVFQSYNLFPHLNVAENIMLAPRVVKNVPKQEAWETAQMVLKQVGLADKVGAYPDELSGGQQQRVAIARSLAMKPKVMLFDEVTSALDPQLTGEVLKTIAELAAAGMTMILVTHEMGFARQVANRTVFMYKGQIWEEGRSEDLFAAPKTPELRSFIAPNLK
ncbi:amino-acid transporter subunit; ATP-binding component of ABC superfamily [uncultured Pleomorphomonas sp.]|uniref:Amino acid ABC transporter ATP-binding protein n=2 Tax=Pleomorphomonas TaxID=261933 RepID=A0A2G9X0Q2_9HYPH|nr:amino acid ABC transporter ATP-binding protein [Pleomorphomonas carboxyditropha]PIP00484.1 amino acid ABC transporter ATP-binding protein [Pleomorphomonas carboxyditropha]SCM75869.1 amino-acid transporter subunit; ATP-binding component of ABC superfamily [uncultured Pleomorphomonas sp.]